MSAGLRFEGVAVRLGGADVLRGIDLDVAPGEVVGLLGRNGAGKTTLLRTATRVIAPDAGSVRVDGDPVTALSRRELARRVAVVPQETHVPFPFRVAEVVLMGRTPHLGAFAFESPADLERAQQALERMGVAHLADRSILEVSGGERQLVMVSRALVQDPRALIFDEPTAFLDLAHRVQVLGAVRELARDGRAALVVTHDLTLADAPDLRERAVLVHFRESLEEREGGPPITFDYKLRPGTATSTNALRLMEIMGFADMDDDAL